MRKLPCKGGYTVEIIDEDHWAVPDIQAQKHRLQSIDFTRLPSEVRWWWRAVMEEAYQSITCKQTLGLWYTALWFTRFQKESGIVTTALDNLNCTDWGSYAEWLKKQSGIRGKSLSCSTRRGQFVLLIVATKQALKLNLPGISSTTIDRLHFLTRHAFKEKSVNTQRYIERRALSSEQYTELYRMMAEEWQRYLDRANNPKVRVHLPALVACWLAFNDGVRSSEINCLTVEDIQIDALYGKHRLYVHAPNKEPDMIPIEKDTLTLLQAMVEEGADARTLLGTNRLFVNTRLSGLPCVLTTVTLNSAIRRMARRHGSVILPDDLRIPDGRTSLGTHLARTLRNRERVRRLMRHNWATTTETYYRAQQKLVVAGNMARALRAEVLRLTVACQRPVLDINERPDQVDILKRNPYNAELEWGSCGLDVARQGGCRVATHCFDCPLLVPWVSKRHNYIMERDEYLRLAEKAENTRDRENLLYHANQAEAYCVLIDRRREEEINDVSSNVSARQRRPRRSSHSSPS